MEEVESRLWRVHEYGLHLSVTTTGVVEKRFCTGTRQESRGTGDGREIGR